MPEDNKSQHILKSIAHKSKMSNASSMRRINAVRNKADRFIKTFQKRSKAWRAATRVRDWHEYTISIQSEKWGKLAAHSKKELKKYLGIMQALAGLQNELNLLYRGLNLSSSELNRLPGSVTEQPEWGKWRKQLSARLKKRGFNQKIVNLLLSRVEETSGKSIVASLQKRLADQMRTLDSLYFSELRGFSAAHFGMTVAHFNTFALQKKSKGLNTKWLGSIERDLTKKEKALWQALRIQNARQMTSQANALLSFSQANLAKTAEQAAMVANRRKSNAQEKSGDDLASIQAGNLLRRLIQSIVLGNYVTWLGKWEPSAQLAVDWIKAAKKMPFDVQAKAQFISVSNFLKSHGASNAIVNIAAWIRSVKISHKGQKAISLAELVDDPKGNQSVNLTIPYIKLDSTGMVPGAFVRLMGKFSSKVEWLNGKNAIVLGRLKYSELREKSWKYWVTAELQSAFDPIPNGLAAESSWETSGNGAGNPLRYGVWFEKKH